MVKNCFSSEKLKIKKPQGQYLSQDLVCGSEFWLDKPKKELL
jgi:hypothetical protein